MATVEAIDNTNGALYRIGLKLKNLKSSDADGYYCRILFDRQPQILSYSFKLKVLGKFSLISHVSISRKKDLEGISSSSHTVDDSDHTKLLYMLNVMEFISPLKLQLKCDINCAETLSTFLKSK